MKAWGAEQKIFVLPNKNGNAANTQTSFQQLTTAGNNLRGSFKSGLRTHASWCRKLKSYKHLLANGILFFISSHKHVRKADPQHPRMAFLEDQQSDELVLLCLTPLDSAPPTVPPRGCLSGAQLHIWGHRVCAGSLLPPLPRLPAALPASPPAQAALLLSRQVGGRALGFFQLGWYPCQSPSLHHCKTACVLHTWLRFPLPPHLGSDSCSGGAAAGS